GLRTPHEASGSRAAVDRFARSLINSLAPEERATAKHQAERGGFEPPVPFPRHSISSAAQSATLPPLRVRVLACLAAVIHGGGGRFLAVAARRDQARRPSEGDTRERAAFGRGRQRGATAAGSTHRLRSLRWRSLPS